MVTHQLSYLYSLTEDDKEERAEDEGADDEGAGDEGADNDSRDVHVNTLNRSVLQVLEVDWSLLEVD